MTHTNQPRRIQRRRTKGWRMPAGAVYVGRPSKWGNPFAVGTVIDRVAMGRRSVAEIAISSPEQAAEAFRQWLDGKPLLAGGHNLAPLPPTAAEIKTALRGRDLACWCPLDQPCHADVLLTLANPCPDGWCPDHDSPRACPEHGPPAGEHPMNVCAHPKESP
ncbi:DUF4326 domain-containing protein [Mycolicibacterium sp.]|uniref:DUF4326 domain-containing protein n=1 Tax=Mycolicibacterium sp. TaxID=2320850 RepID=UPI00355E0CA5